MHKIVIALLVFGLVCIPTAVTQGPYYGSYPSGPYYSGYYENEYEQQRSFDEYTKYYSRSYYPPYGGGGYYEYEYEYSKTHDEYTRDYSSGGYIDPYYGQTAQAQRTPDSCSMGSCQSHLPTRGGMKRNLNLPSPYGPCPF